MKRIRVSKRAHPNALGFVAIAVNCQTNRQATGRKSSGLSVMVPRRRAAKRADAAIFVLDYTVRDERLAYVLYQKAISHQLKQVAVVWSAGSGRLPRFQF